MSSDLFADVVRLEEHFLDEGWEEGLKDGLAVGRAEGLELGYTKGWGIGSEVHVIPASLRVCVGWIFSRLFTSMGSVASSWLDT